jgi:hypothetical protein
MVSSGMLRHVALVKTDVSEQLSAYSIKVTRIGEVGTTLGAKFLRNVGSYKSHTVQHHRRRHSAYVLLTLLKGLRAAA